MVRIISTDRQEYMMLFWNVPKPYCCEVMGVTMVSSTEKLKFWANCTTKHTPWGFSRKRAQKRTTSHARLSRGMSSTLCFGEGADRPSTAGSPPISRGWYSYSLACTRRNSAAYISSVMDTFEWSAGRTGSSKHRRKAAKEMPSRMAMNQPGPVSASMRVNPRLMFRREMTRLNAGPDTSPTTLNACILATKRVRSSDDVTAAMYAFVTDALPAPMPATSLPKITSQGDDTACASEYTKLPTMPRVSDTIRHSFIERLSPQKPKMGRKHSCEKLNADSAKPS
mmetsp:Transcript_768/g.1759  ORF Transcript_768/g.1759 Transcript_768/m.1759 type:complete len:282 (+) Transcript_768:750-1595(+)